jgi:hypothetical protein
MADEQEIDFDAWSEGHTAGLKGWDDYNPYEPGSVQFRSWEDGNRQGWIDRESLRD